MEITVNVNVPALDRLVDYLSNAGSLVVAPTVKAEKANVKVNEAQAEEIATAVETEIVEAIVNATEEKEVVEEATLTLAEMRKKLEAYDIADVKKALTELGVAKLTAVKSTDYAKLLELVEEM